MTVLSFGRGAERLAKLIEPSVSAFDARNLRRVFAGMIFDVFGCFGEALGPPSLTIASRFSGICSTKPFRIL